MGILEFEGSLDYLFDCINYVQKLGQFGNEFGKYICRIVYVEYNLVNFDEIDKFYIVQNRQYNGGRLFLLFKGLDDKKYVVKFYGNYGVIVGEIIFMNYY